MRLPRFSPSLLYLFCRYAGCFALRFLFYRKIIRISDEPLPKKGPVVFLSNHQNAFMDAFLIICSTKQHYPVFFARSDEFQNPILRTILWWLRIAPLYRINRGIRQVSNNLKSFDLATAILREGRSIALFPEGTHYDTMHIHPLKKGTARIIAHAYSQPDWNYDIPVIPVSLTYQNYSKSRTDVCIRFGKPFSTLKYKRQFLHNSAQTLNNITAQIYEHLHSICVHINDLQNYTTLECLLRVYSAANAKTTAEYFVLLKQTTDSINALSKHQPERYVNILQTAQKLTHILQTHQIEPETFGKYLHHRRSHYDELLIILIAPLQFLRTILIFFPFTLIDKISRKIAEDPQFQSSITFSIAFFLTPILTFVQLSFIHKLTNNMFFTMTALFVMLLSPIYDVWCNKYKILRLRRKIRLLPDGIIEQYRTFLKTIQQVLNNT